MPAHEDTEVAARHPFSVRCPRCGMIATRTRLFDGESGWQCTDEPCSHLFKSTPLSRSWNQLMDFLVERNRHEGIADRVRYWR